MPKKPPKNGFFYFMLSYKRRAESNGKTFPGGLPQVAAAASPEWSTLPQFRKDYYNALAKDKRNDPRPNIPKRDEKRFNSQGKSFAEIKMEKARAEERRNQEHDLRDKSMYIIHVNIFCKTDKDVYYPAEIGIVKFSLRGGVEGVFHRYIDPGDITPGYAFEVKDHSERTHKLTPQFVRSVDGSSDYARLYCEICEFLTQDEMKSEGYMPPLFTMYDNVFLNSSLDAVKGTFRSLWAHVHPSDNPSDNNWESVFRVLPLPDMFFHLKNRCMAVTNPQTIAFPNDVLAKAQLQKDTYHYELDTACKFHRDEDIIAHCSQSFVLRWAYIIRDHCADLIGVDLFPKYIAPKTEVKEEDECSEYDAASMTDSQYSNKWTETSQSTNEWGMKGERDRYWSPERKIKREWDRYSPERGVKRERDRYDSPERALKRERDADGYSRSSPVKQERHADGSSSSDVLYEGTVKREKDESVGSMKKEKNAEPSTCDRIKHENGACGYAESAPIKQEKNADFIKQEKDKRETDVSSSIKREKNADFIKQEKDKPETDVDSSIKQEKNADFIKQEKDKPETDGSSSIKREKNADSIKQERDGSVKPEKCYDSVPEEKPGNAVTQENGFKNELNDDVEIVSDRMKVETVDLTYSDW